MTILKNIFAGLIHKAEPRTAGSKQVVELQLCKKNGKDDADGWTWIRVTVWEPPDWMAAKLVKGSFVSGVGDFKLRSYPGSDGTKKVSAEVKCSSFDIEVEAQQGPAGGSSAPAAAPRVPKPAAAVPSQNPNDEEIPF